MALSPSLAFRGHAMATRTTAEEPALNGAQNPKADDGLEIHRAAHPQVAIKVLEYHPVFKFCWGLIFHTDRRQCLALLLGPLP